MQQENMMNTQDDQDRMERRIVRTAESKGYRGPFARTILAMNYMWSFCLSMMAQTAPHPRLRVLLHRMRGVKIGKGVLLTPYVLLDVVYPKLLTIEDGVAIAPGVKIFCHNKPSGYQVEEGWQREKIEPVTLKAYTTIGANAVILPGVTVGPNSVVAPCTVVSRDVPPGSVAVGNPARVMKLQKKES
jgi:acetyltransferase-like isoleucine patch superfamily enzyme